MIHDETPERGLQELTEAEIYAAICYLDPDMDQSGRRDDTAGVVFAAVLYFTGLGCIGFIWFYQLAH